MLITYCILGYILKDWLQVFPSSFSIAALIGAAAIRGRVQASKLGWGENGQLPRGEDGRLPRGEVGHLRRGEDGHLPRGEDGCRGDAGRRRKLSEDEDREGGEVEAKRQRRDDEGDEEEEEGGASPPRQVEVCSPSNPLLAARRLLRDPKELLAIATEERRGELAPARFNFSFLQNCL